MKICSIVSARPNFVKLAAIVHAVQEVGGGATSDAGARSRAHQTMSHANAVPSPAIEHIILHTGQHSHQMFSDVFFEQLNIPKPDYNLGVESRGDNEDTAERTRVACVPVLQEMKPDVVLVYGDVSGALGAAQAAHELGITLAHVEAGLRSFDTAMPEERNRKQIDHLASLIFVSEQSGIENLEREGITEGVHFVGNTMIDTLIRMLPTINDQKLPTDLPERFGVVTLHRPSNVDSKADLERCIEFLNRVAKKCPLIFPVHHRTHESIHAYELQDRFLPSISLWSSLPYFTFLKLVSASSFVITDSGGIQEETVLLQKKCFTLRNNTERPATIQAGSNELIDTQTDIAIDTIPTVTIPKLWDGKAGERIVRTLLER